MSRYARLGALWSAALTFSLAAAFPAAAGNFSVAPIRLEISAGHPTAVMTVLNQDDAPLLIQASTLLWTQPGGEETYQPTRELLATPPVFTLPPNGEQIVRVALRGNADPGRELAYRLLLAEIPQSPQPDFTGLRVSLRLSLPVFVQAPTATHPDVRWSLQWNEQNELLVSAANHGSAHLQVTDFELRFPQFDLTEKVAVTRYVLPGSTVSWKLAAPAQVPRGAQASVRGFSNQGEFAADLKIGGP